MTEVTAGAADSVIYEGSYTTDDRYPDRFVRDSFRYGIRRGVPGRVLGIVGPAIVVALLVQGPDPLVRVGIGLLAVVVFAGISAAFTAFGYRSHLRKIRATIPAGSTYRVSLREDGMSIRDWVISSENAYSLWNSAEIVGDHVILRRASSPIYTPLARELFTPDAEAWLLRRVGAQRA